MKATARSAWTHLALVAIGWGFLLLGIAGLFLPVLQGILFIAVGLIILSRVHPWARAFTVRLRRRFPALNRVHQAARDRARNWLHRPKS